MSLNIRPYKDSDFEMVTRWWNTYQEIGPCEGMMTSNGSFVLEKDSIPTLCVTMFLTQSNVAYLEGFIKNPSYSNISLKEETKMLAEYCYEFARKNGKKHVICYCKEPKLIKLYESLGLRHSAYGLNGFSKEL